MTDGHADTFVPEISPDGLRHWQVATGVIYNSQHEILLVENRRKNGELDWSTPGGVVDPGENAVQGLTREVREETGLVIKAWTAPIYRVEVTAPGFGFFLEVDAYRATDFSGALEIDDPDKIVVSAEFVSSGTALGHLREAPRWVGEPLSELLNEGFEETRLFAYDLVGTSRSNQSVTRRA